MFVCKTFQKFAKEVFHLHLASDMSTQMVHTLDHFPEMLKRLEDVAFAHTAQYEAAPKTL